MTKRERIQRDMDILFHLILAGLAYKLVDAGFMASMVITFATIRLIFSVIGWRAEVLREESE